MQPHHRFNFIINDRDIFSVVIDYESSKSLGSPDLI